ncbi:uncharacterized protein EDB91DRAFT_1083776 [Suillus paluster]|uniref:uncharacterized protein n=1 Tax=Suillus paluster TaxID=48578 RepID=UPI001B874B14|nr:uncharacterized protein EDB91DRAFT_1083776 [Suillus paluster]KAG1735322.1 hypothetical protein EDB91DRAFT_1083776 [Suillus paluster]
MLTCPNCSATFDVNKYYGRHKKQCLKEVETFISKQNNQRITVKKNDKGNFECYCSDNGCPDQKKVYKTIATLKKHMKKVKSHWIGLSKIGQPDPYPPQAIDGSMTGHQPTPTFQEDQPMDIDQDLGIQEQSQSKEISGQPPILQLDHQPDHQDGLLHHPYLDRIGMAVDADLQVLCCLICQVYCQAISEMEIAMTLLNGITGGKDSKVFRGLKVYDSLVCNACAFICGSKKWMQTHHQAEHPSLILPKQWSSCKMQQLNKGANKRFWQDADDEEPLHDHQEVIDRLRREMNEAVRVEQIASEKCMTLLDTTDKLILQRLNLPDPIKEGINNTPLHQHQEMATLKEYIHPTAALLVMLIRTDKEASYFVLLPACLEDVIHDLQVSLMNEERIIQSMHEVLKQADGGHKEASYVMNPLAKLEYCIQLVCLEETKILSASTFDGDDEAALDSLLPCTMSTPRVWWTDRKKWEEMLYKGNKVHIDHLRQMFALMESKLVDLWENKVLVGISMHVCYEDIKDDNTNHDVGYSFLSDRSNSCFADRDRFFKAIIENQETFGRFAIICDGEVIWDKGVLMTWLRDYAEFQKLVLARCEMLSGAPGRSTELTTMVYRNTKRNLVMLGKNLTMLRTYHKSRVLSGLDKLIPHSINGVTADLMIQDLALTRPFAEIAAQICYPDKPEIKEMYQTHLFINKDKLFNTDQLSATMLRESISHISFGLRTSTNWQLLMHTIPGGHGLAYTDASVSHFKELVQSGKFGSDHQTDQAPATPSPSPPSYSEQQQRIIGKLEDRLVKGLEERLVNQVIELLGPALQAIIKDVVNKVIPQEPAVPMNAVDFTDLYATNDFEEEHVNEHFTSPPPNENGAAAESEDIDGR